MTLEPGLFAFFEVCILQYLAICNQYAIFCRSLDIGNTKFAWKLKSNSTGQAVCSKPRESGRSYRCRKQREQPFSWYNERLIATDRVTDMTWYVSIFNTSVTLSVHILRGELELSGSTEGAALEPDWPAQAGFSEDETVMNAAWKCIKKKIMKDSHGWLDEDHALCNKIRQGSDMQWSWQLFHLTVGYICFVQDQWSCYVGSKSGAAPGTAGKMKEALFLIHTIQWCSDTVSCPVSPQSSRSPMTGHFGKHQRQD